MNETKKRKQLSINLGSDHEAWLALSKKYGHKPATFAAAVLRSVIASDTSSLNNDLDSLLPKGKPVTHQHLRLREDEVRILDQYAAIMNQTRHQALVGIVRSITVNQPQFTIGEIVELEKSNYQLRKIGVNLNQIAHRTNTVDFKLFKSSQIAVLKTLINNLIKRTDKMKTVIDKHTETVWNLVNSARYRTVIKVKKLKH